MKTTIEIDDELFRRAKVHAAERGSSLRRVVEDALRRALDDQPAATGFVLRDASGRGSGLAVEYDGRGWAGLAELAYGDAGV